MDNPDLRELAEHLLWLRDMSQRRADRADYFIRPKHDFDVERYARWAAAVESAEVALVAAQKDASPPTEVGMLACVLRGIVEAKRFDREVFRDDTEFVDWAQSISRHALAALACGQPEDKGNG